MSEEREWETKGTTTLYNNPPIVIQRDLVELPNGTSAEFDYLDEPDAVVVFPITSDEKVVTITEWRQAVKRNATGLPGGSIENDESPKAAAFRELEEETGYTADCLELMNTIEVDNGFSNGRHFHFLATGCTQNSEPASKPMEATEVCTKSLKDVLTAAAAGEILDAKTLTGLFLYQLRQNECSGDF
ncbi:NUDIX hydrolase [Haloarcula sp. CGMCC 1.2071]|uniref:NUDIX hydrolase n=1 Tax=Haloarcula sp. CGMCC 1.2071 TaxID=3111454 RepID=UPI00300F1EE3